VGADGRVVVDIFQVSHHSKEHPVSIQGKSLSNCLFTCGQQYEIFSVTGYSVTVDGVWIGNRIYWILIKLCYKHGLCSRCSINHYRMRASVFSVCCSLLGSSLMRRWVCNLLLKLFLGLARAATLGFKFSRTHDHILLSHMTGPSIYIPQEQGGLVIPPDTGFPLRRLLWLAVLWWRYSNAPPHGVLTPY
jgi:hypothetical protein